MLNSLSSANRTLFQYYVSGLFIIDFENESLRFLFFALTKSFLRAERPCNPASLRIRRTVSGEIEEENVSLICAETFTALKCAFFLNFLIVNLSSRLVKFHG